MYYLLRLMQRPQVPDTIIYASTGWVGVLSTYDACMMLCKAVMCFSAQGNFAGTRLKKIKQNKDLAISRVLASAI